MSLTVRVLFVVTLLLSIVIPFGYFLIGQRTKKRYKRAIGTNIFFFFINSPLSSYCFILTERASPGLEPGNQEKCCSVLADYFQRLKSWASQNLMEIISIQTCFA